MLSESFAWLCRFGGVKRRLWRGWYDYLAGYRPATDWTCMNYGFAGIPQAHTCEVPAGREPERWCLQLYHHVASGAPLQGLRVLEVGSGRGGGAAFVHQTFRPQQYIGLDFSERAVKLCRELHRVPGLEFRPGDAEAIPFDGGAFHVVLNVESSHCYGNFSKFAREVRRVLRPDGHFLYTDFRDANQVEAWRAQLRDTGLEILRETDITPNVLAALAQDDTRKRDLIRQLAPRWLTKSFNDFAGTKGSIIERAFASGEMRYLSFVLRKPR